MWWSPAAAALTRMLLSGLISCGLKMKRCGQGQAISALGRSRVHLQSRAFNWQVLAT